MPDPSTPPENQQPPPVVRVVAVLGSSGFVGAAVTAELRERGVEVRPLAAPRLRWPPGHPYRMGSLPDRVLPASVDRLARQLSGVHLVVNAAGLPDGNAGLSPRLYGANALLPTLVARACSLAGVDRLVHLSSAAVQGGEPDAPLDETSATSPFSPYSHSKALGESLLLAEPAPERVLLRSTWVHDHGRAQTRALVRLARSPASCVAGAGSAPTPQVLIGDVAASAAHLALARGPVPGIVLQPHNGMTTGLLLRLLGGHEPRHLPQWAVRAAVPALRGYGQLGRRPHAHARRIEMLLFGRSQVRGWLAEQGLAPALNPEAWRRLGTGPGGAGRGAPARRVAEREWERV